MTMTYSPVTLTTQHFRGDETVAEYGVDSPQLYPAMEGEVFEDGFVQFDQQIGADMLSGDNISQRVSAGDMLTALIELWAAQAKTDPAEAARQLADHIRENYGDR
jgi:hypothetical protein